MLVRRSTLLSHQHTGIQNDAVKRTQFLRDSTTSSYGESFIRVIGIWVVVTTAGGSKYRVSFKHILINGNQIQEIDFSGFHISLAYGLEGLAPPADPYALNLSDARLSDKQQRSAVKLLALTAINAKDRKTAFMAFRNETNREQAGEENKISFTDDLLAVLLEGFLNENPSIAHYLCADKGVELMAIDGNITSRLIEHFTNKNIPILTVHDSYIVEFEYEDELIRVMNDACDKELGITGFNIKSEKKVTPRSLQHHQQQDRSGINVIEGYKTINQQPVTAEGYKNRRQRYLDFKDKYF